MKPRLSLILTSNFYETNRLNTLSGGDPRGGVMLLENICHL